MTKSPKNQMDPALRQPSQIAEQLYIADWIDALGLIPAKVALDAEMNEGYLSSLRSGAKKNPSNAMLRRIALALGLDDWRLLYEPPPSPSVIGTIRNMNPQLIERLARASRKGND